MSELRHRKNAGDVAVAATAADHVAKPEEVVKSLPEEVFRQSSRKAILTLFLSVTFMALGYYCIYKFPWYLLPVGWTFVAIVATGVFSVGYACSKDNFFNPKNTPAWVNRIVGAVCMMPMLYSFEQWRLQHNNSNFTLQKCMGPIIESPLWLFSSIWEFFSTNVYFEKKKSVVINAVALYAFAGIFFTVMGYYLGLLGLFKYYFMPLIAYHVVMSVFLKVNNMAWKDSKLPSFPRLVEFLSNNCNHQYAIRVQWKDSAEVEKDFVSAVSSLIPNYNLNAAKAALKKKLDEVEEKFNFETIRKLIFNNKPLPALDIQTGLYCIITPILSIYGMFFCTFYWKTWVLAFIGYYSGGIGITAGYHRLFSHRSYEANWFVRFIMAFIGVSTFQGPILKWCSDHRIHHRYTDTDKDPYNIKRGFFYAHMGWLFYERDQRLYGVEDLQEDPILRFQYKYYTPLAFAFGYFLPMIIAGVFWGDWIGGLLVGGIASKTFLHHCTFFINSLAHTWGNATFADDRSPRDSYFVSLLTFGEGYHNFHHTFPFDYRNGVYAHHYDPGKWLIWVFHKLGWAWNLKRFDEELFEKGKIQMRQKILDAEMEALGKAKKQFDWGKPIESLPVITMQEFEAKAKHEMLVLIDGIAHDVSGFIDKHPSGPEFIQGYIGKDATKAFNGVVYNHSSAARNILPRIRSYRVSTSAAAEPSGETIIV